MQGALGQRALLAGSRIPKFTLHGGSQAREIVLEQVILRPGFHDGHGQLFTDRGRYDDEGYVTAALVQQQQGGGCIQLRQTIVRDDDIPRLLGERGPHFRRGHYTLGVQRVAGPG